MTTIHLYIANPRHRAVRQPLKQNIPSTTSIARCLAQNFQQKRFDFVQTIRTKI